ncbi:MAG: sigma-70 family RNA polymerase sigma factor [Acidobacteriota bacterium]
MGLAEQKRMDKAEWIRQALQEFERPLTRYAARLMGDLERGRDVVQDTFMRLCQEKPPRIRDHLAEWLFTVCRNRALDVLRKESRMSTITQTQIDARPGQQPGPLRVVAAREDMSRVSRILSGLPERQQELVRLKFQEELSYREMSRVTGLSETNVGFILHTALKTVRRKLKNQANAGARLQGRIS